MWNKFEDAPESQESEKKRKEKETSAQILQMLFLTACTDKIQKNNYFLAILLWWKKKENKQTNKTFSCDILYGKAAKDTLHNFAN